MSQHARRSPHESLDACHREMLVRLDELSALARRLAEGDSSDAVRGSARRVEEFFSGTARQHHALEESSVFPALSATATPELTQTLRALQQDHGWIEENWIELSPQLVALADGHTGLDPDEFAHGVEVYLELVRRHIDTEESLVYPASRAMWGRGQAA